MRPAPIYGHMLTEMAQMAAEDGMVMQIHAGSRRNTNAPLFASHGPDKGADIPVAVDWVGGLSALLDRVGNDPRLRLILFTLDESTYARELAPMAGHWPCLRIGPPWWFHDSLNGIRRYFDRVVETAGYRNLAGFNDDTRAFLSIPARHDTWRRAVALHLAEQVDARRAGPRRCRKAGALSRPRSRHRNLPPVRTPMPRILHLGLGNFHRAHQAWHTARAGGDWRITGVVMGNAALYEALSAQGGAYHLGIRGPEGLTVKRITLHDRLLLARGDPRAVIAAIAEPEVQIVTLTVTEKGYCLGTDGRLDLAHPAIAEDLAQGPRSAIGMLTHGLAARGAPLTVVSCDNVSGNGHKLRAAVGDFARAAGLILPGGLRFPDTMVDRITPATTDAIRDEIAAASGVEDAAPVLTEAFSEWVIADDFAGPRPAWEKAGVEIVPDVAPFEMRKLRLLNAAHSYLAYAGLLAGHRYVHEAIADRGLRDGVDRLWDEAQATLPEAVLPTTPAYRAALTRRFGVAEMRHELAQIAGDGSLKLPERIVPLVTAPDAAPQAMRAIAAWVAFVQRAVERGEPLNDPNAERLAECVRKAAGTRALCADLAALIGLGDVADDWLDGLAAEVDRVA